MIKTNPSDLDDTQRQKISEYLGNHPVGVLAAIDTEGNPHGSTLYFSVEPSLDISFTTKRDTFKYKNLLENPRVMLVVFDAASQSSVQVSGLAKEVTGPEAAHDIYLGTLRAAKGTGEDVVPPVAKLNAGPYVAFTIVPEYFLLSEYGWGDNFKQAMEHADDPNRSGDPA